MSDDALRDLARRAGVATEWQDYAERPHTITPEVLRRILAGLGLPAETRGDLAASRRLVSRRTNIRDLPPLVTATSGRPTRLDAGGNEPQPAKLELEQGGSRDISLVPARGRLRVPAINETGYHRLLVEDREIVLAVAPPRCREIDDVVPDARLWGIAAQVYGLKSPGDLGIGDAGGISSLAEAAGRRGADALLLSPLHALFAADPTRFSPYSPSSRMFLNPLHANPRSVLDPTLVDRALAEASEGGDSPPQDGCLIDWPSSSAAKYRFLRILYDLFLDGPDAEGALGTDFANFRADGGSSLEQHARFEALHASMPSREDWRSWPMDLRDPNSPAVSAFSEARRREVTFHIFLQWLADRSLRNAQQNALRSGMRVGLIGDLAVGMDPGGSHVWSRQSDVLLGLTIGAPPDLLNPMGQSWGLTSFSPRALVDRGFAPFIETMRAGMRNVGGVRIDHAMGLARLWLVPEGASPADGAYLNFPLPDLLRVIALESARQGAVVIGEDLGTVPPGFSQSIEQAGIHGMRVLWFERDQSGFSEAAAWQRSAVAMTSTHDLPTIAGWWKGSDLIARDEHGRLGNNMTLEKLEEERAEDRKLLWERLVAEGTIAGDPPAEDAPEVVVDGVLKYVCSTDSVLCLIPLEDLLGQVEQPNLPGTVDEHPNWRRRLPDEAENLLNPGEVERRVEFMSSLRPHR